MGLFKLGNLVRYVPASLIIGFTKGIAVLVALSQAKDALGLQLGKTPADFFGLLAVVGKALPTTNPYAVALTLVCLVGLAVWPRLWKSDGAMLRVLDGARFNRGARGGYGARLRTVCAAHGRAV